MIKHVALLAEGGDRNLAAACRSSGGRVALLAEGGDRNSSSSPPSARRSQSPSSRRAGIEIES